MNKRLLILICVAIIAALGVFFATKPHNTTPSEPAATGQEPTSTLSAAMAFQAKYPLVPEDHRFVEIDADQARDLLEKGSGMLFMGFPECPWCQQLAPLAANAAKQANLSAIYYLNIRTAKAKQPEAYMAILQHLEAFLPRDEAGEIRLSVPDVTAVQNGKVAARFKQEQAGEDEAITSAKDYWAAPGRKDRAVQQLKDMMLPIVPHVTKIAAATKPPLLLDVRTAEEFSAGHLQDAHNLPLDRIEAGDTPPRTDKTDPIWIYCRSGNRSSQAVAALQRAGYTNLKDLGSLQDAAQTTGKAITR